MKLIIRSKGKFGFWGSGLQGFVWFNTPDTLFKMCETMKFLRHRYHFVLYRAVWYFCAFLVSCSQFLNLRVWVSKFTWLQVRSIKTSIHCPTNSINLWCVFSRISSLQYEFRVTNLAYCNWYSLHSTRLYEFVFNSFNHFISKTNS